MVGGSQLLFAACQPHYRIAWCQLTGVHMTVQMTGVQMTFQMTRVHVTVQMTDQMSGFYGMHLL